MSNPAATQRLPALDWMRGLVILLMVSDHAGEAFYSGHLIADSAFFPDRGLPTVPFLHRWLSHICAPTFVFLAGAGIMLSRSRRPGAGMGDAGDRMLLLRGALLIGLELSLISALWAPKMGAVFFLQVLWALGVGMVLMIPCRHLRSLQLLGLGLAVLVGAELLAFVSQGGPAWLVRLFLTGSRGDLMVAYPALPWFAPMLLGAAFGRALGEGRLRRPGRLCAGLALACAVLFVILRSIDQFGHMGLNRPADATWIRWIHLSKYPPSLVYLTATLGLMFACLAGFFALQERRRPRDGDPLLLVGQTPLFFYILHIPLLSLMAYIWGSKGGLGLTWLMVLLCCLLLLPLCAAWRHLRRQHPDKVLLRLI